jgi:uncharacterized protein
VNDLLLAVALAIIATLYSAAGQAGGTGYVAALGLAGIALETIKPSALALNVLVSGIGCIRFYRAGLFAWRNAYPFGVLGLPFSFIGGALHLPPSIYQPVVGAMLFVAGVQMIMAAPATAALDQSAPSAPPFVASMVVGGIIGFASGVTGIGGGIFLAPVVLALGWAKTRETAATSAVFNFINSSAGLLGAWAILPSLPAQLPVWLVSAGLGGLLGSRLGLGHLTPRMLRVLLAALLLLAATRMLAASLG